MPLNRTRDVIKRKKQIKKPALRCTECDRVGVLAREAQ